MFDKLYMEDSGVGGASGMSTNSHATYQSLKHGFKVNYAIIHHLIFQLAYKIDITKKKRSLKKSKKYINRSSSRLLLLPVVVFSSLKLLKLLSFDF